MIIGVPKEVKDHETRVGLVPSGVTALREAGHEVLVQTQAGEGTTISDDEYARRAPTSCNAAELAGRPGGQGQRAAAVRIPPFPPGLILFTYLHLAPLPELTIGCSKPEYGIAYETIVKRTAGFRC